MAILVTGGAGFIGTHTIIELIQAGYDAVILDNFVNTSANAVKRVEEITGKKIPCYDGDIADRDIYKEIFADNVIEACIHFAGLKAVGESVKKPLEYYENNVSGSIVLFDELRKRGVKKLIFSSSATVYGDPAEIPIPETCPKGAVTNPYGRTKAMLEDIICDMEYADEEWDAVILRYFNPIGAHKSGRIGENPNGIPNNLMPYITQVAVGKLEKLNVFGGDYDTPDGTGVRDYIHVTDLAKGHVASLKRIGVVPEGQTSDIEVVHGVDVYNLGTGQGNSVLDVVKAFEEATGVHIPYEIKERRPGDIANMYCDASKAKKELHWEGKKTLKEMCADSWNWQKNNTNGYEDN